MVEREIPMEEQVLPMPDIVPLLPVDAIEEETLPIEDAEEEEEEKNKTKKNKSKLACQLVSIVLEQKLAEVELELQVPGSSRLSSAHHHAVRPSLINTRCPGGRPKAPLRTQESVAWEYHQNPSCSFNIRLDRAVPIRPAAKSRLAAILGHSATVGQTVATTPTPLTTTTTTSSTPSTTTTNPSPLGSAAKVRRRRARTFSPPRKIPHPSQKFLIFLIRRSANFFIHFSCLAPRSRLHVVHGLFCFPSLIIFSRLFSVFKHFHLCHYARSLMVTKKRISSCQRSTPKKFEDTPLGSECIDFYTYAQSKKYGRWALDFSPR
jgi:hypothetical protein